MRNKENPDNSKTKMANKKTQRANEDRGNDTGMQDRGRIQVTGLG